MPLISGGSSGGGLPSQWTAGSHGDVTATTDDPTLPPLTVQGAGGSGGGDDIFVVEASGFLRAIEVVANGAGSISEVDFATAGPTLALQQTDGVITSDTTVRRYRGQTAAPASALLSSSEFALWLDATPGATKLMVKAKDSGGTVRTATINLA